MIHCSQLILRKISKTGATRCQILRLKCTKFDFRWGSAPDPAGRAYSTPPDPLAVFKGPASKRYIEGGGNRELGEEKGKGKGREGRTEGMGMEMRAREGNGSMRPLGFSKVGAYAFLNHQVFSRGEGDLKLGYQIGL